MSGVISLRDKAYKKQKIKAEIENKKGNELYEVVDEIVSFLVENQTNMIVEIDRNEIEMSEINKPINDFIKENNIVVADIDSMEEIESKIKSTLWGYGAINEYIEDLDVSDIAIKGVDDFWIKVNGKRKQIKLPLYSQKSIENFCHSVALRTSGNLSQRNALLLTGDTTTNKDFNLRINIGIPPVTDKPYVLIRKIPKWHIKPNMNTLYERKMFNKEVQKYLEDMSKYGLNFLICGQGGSGKTTLLNAVVEEVPEEESKLAIQEIPELSSGGKNWCWLNVINAKTESEVEYSLERLALQGLTMDVDRYYIGESKGAESMAIFDASFTGHKVAFTVHAPNTMLAIDKVVFNMKKSGTDYTDEKLEYLLSTLDVLIFMDNYKVCEITEVEGWDNEKKHLKLRPMFKYKKENWNKINESCDRVNEKLQLAKEKMK